MKRLLTSNITPNPVDALLESCEKCANLGKNLGLLCLFLHSLKICLCATWMKMTSFVLLQRKYMYLNNTFKLYFQVTYEQITDQWTEWMLMKNRCCTITMIPWIIRSVSQSVHESVNQSVSQSDSQWVRESVSQSVSQTVSESVNQSISQSMNWSINLSLVNKPINQSVRQSVHLSTRQYFFLSPYMYAVTNVIWNLFFAHLIHNRPVTIDPLQY